ncbi:MULTISPECIES: ferredoxin [unclassified Kitasatospora]|uniref:ferredoxin n=1 Tax=unclassified Kitasatospora TaxID=2633591 RepID=UPI00070DB948|nr:MULTISPECIES: ferredoxin [unclassified Kitasatospora]KQV12046.1 cytochrome [Kitasatospora sp. Root107]KRB72587.1 cytochrome [Kitasatospora sp. Root187]
MSAALESRVDRARCVGTGACAATAPADLTLGPDGRAQLLAPVPVHLGQLTEAAELCPVEAITIHRADTGDQVAPAC